MSLMNVISSLSFRITGVVLLVFLSISTLRILSKEKKKDSQLRYWAMDKPTENTFHLDECLAQLWTMKKRIYNYYESRGYFPKGFEEIFPGSYLRHTFFCPVTEREYIYVDFEGLPKFSCPNPDVHGVRAIYCGINTGAPIVEPLE